MPDSGASRWLQVGELTDGFGGNEPAPTDSLAGRAVALAFEDRSRIELAFRSGSELQCGNRAGGALAESFGDGPVRYTATSLRPGIVLVDFVPPGHPPRSVSLVVDLNAGIGTAVLGRLPLEPETRKSLYARASAGEELTPVGARLLPFVLAGAASPHAPHAPTAELVGRRVLYEYGPRDAYEHIYLNERYYTWQCLRGPEQGLTDTDRCHYRRIAEQLYLFVWLEKIVPTLGVALVDLEGLRSTGKLFGYRGNDFGAIANKPIGARARLLNVTVHPRWQ